MNPFIKKPHRLFRHMRALAGLGADRAARRRLALCAIRANLAQVHKGYTDLFNRLLSNGPSAVDLALNEARRFWFRPGSTDLLVLHQIFLQHEYAYEEMAGLDIRYIVDLGANIGVTALYWSNLYPEATLILVEPDEGNVKVLERNMAEAPNPVHIVQAAIAEKPGTVTLHMSNRDWAHSTHPIARTRPVGAKEVRAVTIDELVSEFNLPRIDMVKMDIEGAEAVIMPTLRHWQHRPRLLFAELHDPYMYENFAADCEAAGFEAFPPRDEPPIRRQPVAIRIDALQERPKQRARGEVSDPAVAG